MKEYCQCKHRTINSDSIVFLMGNSAYCEKCERYIHSGRVVKLCGSSQPGRLMKIKDDSEGECSVWKDNIRNIGGQSK